MLDPRKLRLLRELARRGTIAAVAEALSYTPSAVSQQIAALEREAGRQLLTRTGRRVTLTPAGSLLVEHAEAVLAALEHAESALAASDSSPAGPVRLGTFPTALRTMVVPALQQIAHTASEVDLQITEVDPADVPDLLRVGELDMALVHEYDNVPSVVGSGIELEPLLDEVVYLAASSSPPDGADDGIGIHAESRWIVAGPGTLCRSMTFGACRSRGFEPRVAHTVDDFAAVLQLVAAGAGVALVPELGATGVPAGVSLTALPIGRRTRIAYRRGSRSRPAFAAVSAELHRAVDAFRTAE